MTDPLAMFRNGGTPQANSTTDPRVQAGIDYVNAHGGDPKQAAIQLLKERMPNEPIPSNPFRLAMKILNGRQI